MQRSIFLLLFILEWVVALNSTSTCEEMAEYLLAHPQRAYMSRLFRDGPYRNGVEIGVAGGRFTDHMTSDGMHFHNWQMVEPFPPSTLLKLVTRLQRRHPDTNFELLRAMSLEDAALENVRPADFVYLDGAHDYENVKFELTPYFAKVVPGGMLAGHDYCNYGEPALDCLGCEDVPLCGPFATMPGRASNQAGVVRAVQEWLVENHPKLRLYHTQENFTRDSLEADGMNYDLVLTKTRNPSWFVFKPTRTRRFTRHLVRHRKEEMSHDSSP